MNRLIDRIVSQIAADGAVRTPCESRILESALLYALLDKTDLRNEKLGAFLDSARPSGFLDERLAHATLHGPGDPGPVLTYLQSYQHVTGPRKRVLIEAVLGIVGELPFTSRPEPPHYGPQASWTELTLCAIGLLHGHARGLPPDPRDLAQLISRLEGFGAESVWEGNVLAHLIALHALHNCRPDSPLLSKGIDAITRTANPDGGIPFIEGQTVWVTALAGTALTLAGAPEPITLRMADYLADLQIDGAWGYTETTTQTDVDDTTRCMHFLRTLAPQRYAEALRKAEKYLVAMADSSGGYSTYLSGHAAETDLTAGAVIALAPSWPRHAPLLNASLAFLLDAQREDGSFAPSWTASASSVLAHVLQALTQAPPGDPRIPQAIATATRYLARTQNPDGGWGHQPGAPSDAISTAHALPVAASHGSEVSRARAAAYLLSHRRPDGGFTAPPDQVGPRPIPFDYPVLADIHVLTALAEQARENRSVGGSMSLR
ncbi:hypothetical protein FCH28_06160 [Streptomyces piniterrae]|uniref:Squalene cyclase C-terminal domain-containing protein n=1 Tax=Streptomyces piniterrae TaxID=2571125 RepID=A0A4U0NRJ7_9ACTN|nr:prenyltransferase/squalene oxidase repeat-containing protein [Streptomyces piniterrae]TJZ57050.1 hypothetical protein FCH28_06160 [Streptomyces piniterrae]